MFLVMKNLLRINPFLILLTATCHAATNLPPLPITVTRTLGTTSQREIMMNRTVPWAGAHLGGVHVDTSKTPNRIYTIDSANNRILGFHGYRPPRPDGSFPRADIVIGQPSLWDHAAVNGDDMREAKPSNQTIGFIPHPEQISTAEGPRAGMMATDSDGNLYVADLVNNRVLKFNDPFATDTIADDVWGQTSYTNRSIASPPSASSLNIWPISFGPPAAGVDVDTAGNLWVADCGNNRVLRFPSGSKTADLVLGQTSFTTANSGFAPSEMWKPKGVRVHPLTGELFVIDGEESPSCRIMVFAPPFTNGQAASRVFGQPHLNFARGFTLDPRDSNAVWVTDAGHSRILKFHSGTGVMLDVIGSTDFNVNSPGQYVAYNGAVETIVQADGGPSFDQDGNLYFTTLLDHSVITRVPTPLTRNPQGLVMASGQLLQTGLNQKDGRTVQDQNGMALANGQLFLSDSPYRLLVWTNAAAARTYQSADFIIGQSSFDQDNLSYFGASPIQTLAAKGGYLFASADGKIFIFSIPVTGGGTNYPMVRILESGSAHSNVSIRWDDDGVPVQFTRLGGLLYDPAKNALWVSDIDHNRVLRVRNPTGVNPRVDLVLGQTSKTGALQNHGQGVDFPDARGFAQPYSLALDNFDNLYVVDSGFDVGEGNMRALRFDAASVIPTPGNIFPNPAATGVFCKPDLTTNRSWNADGSPNKPTFIAFDSQNHMVLLAESYANPQFQRAYYYPTPHLGPAPQPSNVINSPFGNPVTAIFDEADNLMIQDLTWNRVLFYTASSNAPVVQITNRLATVSANASSVTITGTNNSAVVGTMTWATSAGISGVFPAASAWSVAVPLGPEEVTIININGTNNAGFLGSEALSVARPALPAPALSPSGGSFTGTVVVAFANFATNVEMRFTLDGTPPNPTSPLFTQPFLLSSNVDIQARTFQPGRAPSEITLARFDLYASAPVISPPGGLVTGMIPVTMNCDTPSAEIRYTLNGLEPNRSDKLYTGVFPLDYPAILKAKAFVPGAHESTTTTALFTNGSAAASVPVISPPGGLIAGSANLTMTCSNAGAEIYFTMDGSDPNRYSLLYTAPVTLTNGSVIKARAYVSGLVPSGTAVASFSVLQSWASLALPDASIRNRHSALGGDGTNLYFTRGYDSAVPFSRIAKGMTSGWVNLAPLPIPEAIYGVVGSLSFFDGGLWTLGTHDAGANVRCVYRYDIPTDSWNRGVPFVSDDGPDTALVVIATNRMYAGWSGWDRIKHITDWQAGFSTEAGTLSGGAANCWDSCVGSDFVYFIKHHGVATNSGILGLVNKAGSPTVSEILAMPFNVGWGDAIEYLSGQLFADRHDRLYILRGTTGSTDGNGDDWLSPVNTNQLAIYDLVAQKWSVENLPFTVDDGSEMCLVGDTLYILAANGDPQPLKMARFQPLVSPPAPPRITISQNNGTAHMTWTNSARSFVLEQATSLAPPVAWSYVTIGTNGYSFGTSTNLEKLFFRLRQP
jgi:hypothetical protein